MAMAYESRGKYFEDFNVGDIIETAGRTVREADIVLFAGLSGDYNPLHTNAEWAKNSPFGVCIAHGILTLAITSGLIVQSRIFEGTSLGLLGTTEKYTAPVRPGDTIHVEIEVMSKKESAKGGKGIIEFKCRTINQDGIVVLEHTETTLLKMKGERV